MAALNEDRELLEPIDIGVAVDTAPIAACRCDRLVAPLPGAEGIHAESRKAGDRSNGVALRRGSFAHRCYGYTRDKVAASHEAAPHENAPQPMSTTVMAARHSRSVA